MEKVVVDSFFALVRSGLWADIESTDLRNQGFAGSLDWRKVYQLAGEQSVIGLVLSGIEHSNVKPPQELLLQWIGEVQMLEQQNKAMNQFVSLLIDKLRSAGVYNLLLKGQGVAQCYEKPLWRACGDVDLFLSNDNYEKAKQYLLPLSSSAENEYPTAKHLAMTIDSWVVELHGLLRCTLSSRINRELDQIRRNTFYEGNVRSWLNNGVQVFMLGVENDIIYVFVHFLNHFYKGGIGLRQICDWCRLIWTYRTSLNCEHLESRISKMGLMTEWKAFGAFAVDYLGMPSEAMPMYSPDKKWKRKADKICAFIMEVGNFGHNRDLSYFQKYPYLIRKVISFSRRCGDVIKHVRIFPLDSLRFFPYIMYNGIKSAVRGE